ncbi:MAG: rhomboid family intramembrane serine protease [Lentisphaeria bacterium]|nr:rhomboid family intramembrane serine protease [Lentisphaeria bacterium]
MYDPAEEPSGNSAMRMLFGVIGLNALAFIVFKIKPELANLFYSSLETLKNLELWRPLSSIFVNGDGLILFLQMIMLLSFGVMVVRRMTASQFFSLFLAGGIIGNLLVSLVFFRHPEAPVFGCEGAVYGLIFASAMIAPDFQCYLLFIPFPIKMRTMAILFLVIDLILMRYQALGGVIGAYLFMRLFMRELVLWDILDFFGAKGKEKSVPYVFTNRTPRENITVSGEGKVDMNEADRVLEKLSRTGINSLTEEEIALLEKLRKEMNQHSGR